LGLAGYRCLATMFFLSGRPSILNEEI